MEFAENICMISKTGSNYREEKREEEEHAAPLLNEFGVEIQEEQNDENYS